MNKIWLGSMFVLMLSGMTFAQECGPGCPVCSGAGANSGALLPQKTLLVSGLSIPTADEERAVINTRYGILSWLDVGLGYAVRSEKALWNLRVQPVLEQEGSWQPGIIIGSGSVQTGGSDQSAYVQFIKSLEISEIIGLQLSVGAATYVPDFDKAYGQAGFTASLNKRYAVFANYDGESFHEGVSWTPSDWLTLSFLMVESEYPAISVVFKR